MQTLISNLSQDVRAGASPRTLELFHEAEENVHRRADRLFAWLMLFQWTAGIVAAVWISPRTWIGASSQVHWHVWAAVFLGGAITSLPVYLAFKQPGRALTRHTIAVAQMFFSALLIHLTGGRIETHFHVFGSLAFLAFYRDWRVLVTATSVVALDHFLRGTFWPQSVFGVLSTSPWRWIEHAGWVLFEDFFLIISIRQGLTEMLGLAERQASLETINAGIERKISERTAELRQEIGERRKAEEALRESQGLYHSLVEQLPMNVYRKDSEGRFVYVNSRFCQVKGKKAEEILGKTVFDLNVSRQAAAQNTVEHETIMRTGQTIELEESYLQPGSTMQYFQVVKLPVMGSDGRIVGTQGVQFDITQRKQAEEKLAQMHKQLVDASRQAGMAEVATSVLHNVGNVLNSVNVSSALITEKVRASKVPNLKKAATLIREHETNLGDFFANDPKGKQLPSYLSNLASHLLQEQEEILREAGGLVGNLTHIKEIVSMQQNYAKTSGLLDTLKITDLVEDAINLNNGAISRHQVKLVREFEELPPQLVDKHKVLQILVNLIRNAKHACDDSGRTDKQITLRVANGAGRIKISVADNGIGIPPENLTRIFGHGFTTRKEGHGFGLHSGALAAREIGGSLAAFSEGPGRGATFTLEIPVKQPK
jgi:hypothetical protein